MPKKSHSQEPMLQQDFDRLFEKQAAEAERLKLEIETMISAASRAVMTSDPSHHKEKIFMLKAERKAFTAKVAQHRAALECAESALFQETTQSMANLIRAVEEPRDDIFNWLLKLKPFQNKGLAVKDLRVWREKDNALQVHRGAASLFESILPTIVLKVKNTTKPTIIPGVKPRTSPTKLIFPKTYSQIWQQRCHSVPKESKSGVQQAHYEAAIQLLEDYAGMNGTLGPHLTLFFKAHWFRHETSMIRKIIHTEKKKVTSNGCDATQLLQTIMNTLSEKGTQLNPKGSLAKRLRFIKEQADVELDVEEVVRTDKVRLP